MCSPVCESSSRNTQVIVIAALMSDITQVFRYEHHLVGEIESGEVPQANLGRFRFITKVSHQGCSCKETIICGNNNLCSMSHFVDKDMFAMPTCCQPMTSNPPI